MICIIFENCDHVYLENDMVKEFTVHIKEQNVDLNSEVCKEPVIDNLHMKIETDKLNDITTQFYESYMDKNFDKRNEFTLVHRLSQYKDITQVEVIDDVEYANNTGNVQFRYHVYWHDDDEYNNRYQEVKVEGNTAEINIDGRESKKEFGVPQDHMWSLEKQIEFARQYLNLDKEHPEQFNPYTAEQIRALALSSLEAIERDFKKIKENSRILEPVPTKDIQETMEKILNTDISKTTINGQKFPGADYPNIPLACRYCRNHPLNGGSGICHCTIGVQPLTM